jgi:acetyl esterase/lipase
MGSIAGSGMSAEELSSFYRGIAPSEWVEFTLEGAVANSLSAEQVQQGIAMYAAQRDAKAAVRWILANSATYNINLDFITVGGASAGAITAIALGISELQDFRDEIPLADDATLSTANLDETYAVKSIVYFWGSNVKLEVFEGVYGLNRYDAGDPELLLAHGTNDINASTPFSEATELKDIYDPLGVHVELLPLEGKGHGAWDATVDGKTLSELTFDFLVERQGFTIE